MRKETQEKRNTDIVKDSEFNKSNEIFRAVSTNLKRKRLGGLTTILPFQSRIFRNCTVNTPFGLQRKVWCEITSLVKKRERKFEINEQRHIKEAEYDVGRMYVYQFSLLMSWIKNTGLMLLGLLLKVGCISYHVLFFYVIHIYGKIFFSLPLLLAAGL